MIPKRKVEKGRREKKKSYGRIRGMKPNKRRRKESREDKRTGVQNK